MRRGMIRSDEGIRQRVDSDASRAASSRKKDGTAIVSQKIDRGKSQYQSDDEQVKERALGSRCQLGASGGSDAARRPFAEGRSTQRIEGYRRVLIHPNKDSDKRRGATEGLPYLDRTASGKEKLECGEPAKGALSELSRSGAQNGRDGVMANLVDLASSYAKQETNPETLKRAKLAPHHTPE